MTYVEVAIGVRGREDDRIGVSVAFAVVDAVAVVVDGEIGDFWIKDAGGFPSAVNFRFVLVWFITRRELHRLIIPRLPTIVRVSG